MSRLRMFLCGRAYAWLSTVALFAAGVAQAATFTVTSTADSGNGTLRAAMASAMAAASPPHTIQFTVPGDSVIALASALPTINTALTITGLGINGLTIDGMDAVRPFATGTGGALTLRNLQVRNGRVDGSVGSGGCIDNPSTFGLVLDRVLVRGCRNLSTGNGSALGGAVSSQGPVFVDRSTFVDNRVDGVGAAAGGAIRAIGLATIDRSVFDGNVAVGGSIGNGGAISAGRVLITRSEFTGNRAENTATQRAGFGGAVRTQTDSTSTIRQSLFFANVAHLGSGVSASPTSFGAVAGLTFSNNTLAGNSGGAALYLNDAQVTLKNNTSWKNASTEARAAHLAIEGMQMRFNAASNNLFAATADASPACSALDVPADLAGHEGNLFTDLSCEFISLFNLYIPNEGQFIRGLRRTGSVGNDTPVVDFYAGARSIDGGQAFVAPGDASPFACTAGDARDEDRPADGDADGTARCDIGALELQHEAPLFADDFDGALLR